MASVARIVAHRLTAWESTRAAMRREPLRHPPPELLGTAPQTATGQEPAKILILG
jgi:hypothetical protein